MVKISFIIVTYNSHLLITDCLYSIYTNADLPEDKFEIIIVDNSNSEGHQNLINTLAEFQKNNLHIIHNPANNGYGAGNNIGVKHSKGKLIAIMNPDVRILTTIMQKTIVFFQNHQQTGVLSYKQLGGNNLTFYSRPEHKIPLFDGINTKFRNRNNKFHNTKDFLSGAFFFADKNKFLEIGLFDEKIFMYNEESDIAKRFLAKDYSLHLDPSEQYLHLIEERPFSEKAFKEELLSLKNYIQKYNLNENTIEKKYQNEFKIKKIIAKILNRETDKIRFEKMISLIKLVFK